MISLLLTENTEGTGKQNLFSSARPVIKYLMNNIITKGLLKICKEYYCNSIYMVNWMLYRDVGQRLYMKNYYRII